MKAGGILHHIKLRLIKFPAGEKVAGCVEKYNRFISRIEELDLVSVGDAKTVLTVWIRFTSPNCGM